MYFFTEFVPKYLGYLLQGALVTLELSFISMAAGIAIGIACAIGAIAGGRVVRKVVQAYVSICRGVPLIVILLFVYFTLPEIGVRFNAFWAGVFGLSINLGAYLSEVFRAAIMAVDSGQMQARLSMGLKKAQIYRKIILPQAAVIAVPTVGGYFISLLKDCALVSFISVDEMLGAIDAVRPEDVEALLHQVLDEGQLSLLTLGPVDRRSLPRDLGRP